MSHEERVARLKEIIQCSLTHPALPVGDHTLQHNIPVPPGIGDLYPRLYEAYLNSTFKTFKEPVHAVREGLHTYYSVVKEPMSIRTLLDNMVGGKYTVMSQVEGDVKKIESNCVQFNGQESVYSKEAAACVGHIVGLMQTVSRPSFDDVSALFEEIGQSNVMEEVIAEIGRTFPDLFLDGEVELTMASREQLSYIRKVFHQFRDSVGQKRPRDC